MSHNFDDIDLPDALVEWFDNWKTMQLARQQTHQAAFDRTLNEINALPGLFDTTLGEILTLPMTLHPKGLE